MRGDPYRLSARYPGKCAKCGESIRRGESIFYYPNSRTVYSGKCADTAEADFRQNAQFEADVSGGYSGGGF